MSDKMSIDQKDPSTEDTPVDSKASSPDHDDSPSALPDAQPVKRKGGRKPVCFLHRTLCHHSLHSKSEYLLVNVTFESDNY